MSPAVRSCTPAALASADPALKAAVLAEALPYLRRYSGQTILVKYGGHAMGGNGDTFARDIAFLKQVGIHPIVVHGGGPQISSMLQRLGIKSSFVNGLRVTDQATLEVVEMVLSGSINKQLAAEINAAGGRAVGISGQDGELGFVGEPERIDNRVLDALHESHIIPVIAPLGIDAAGATYNINADTVAGAIAASAKAARFLLLTDVPGVLDAKEALIAELTAAEARSLIASDIISGGMTPKVETCLDAVAGGVDAAVIVDGRVPHAILLELFTEGGAGTLIRGG